MTYQSFRTEEGARLYSIHQHQLGYRTCVVQWTDRWEVRSWK